MDKNQNFVKICIVEHQIEVDFSFLGLLCQELTVEKENGVMEDNVSLKILTHLQHRRSEAQQKSQKQQQFSRLRSQHISLQLQ